MTYPEHIDQLASAFHVRLVRSTDLQPHEAFTIQKFGGPVVFLHPIVDETTYAVALHEIGHILAPTGSLTAERRASDDIRRMRNLVAEEERAAWAWARHYALEWTPTMEAIRRYALMTYRLGMMRQSPNPNMA